MPSRTAARKQVADLGDDELVAILQLASGDSISAKFTLAQVSRQWRATSLAAAELWSRFLVRTMQDALRLPTVLERARRALLDVSLDFSSRRKKFSTSGELELLPSIDAHDRAGIYSDLSPRMPRVRRLAIDFGLHLAEGGWSEPLDELFCFAIPRMEDLSIVWRTSYWALTPGAHQVQQVLPVMDAAFRLRSLRLVNVVPTGTWPAILLPGIETLYLDTCIDDPDLLCCIIKTCPRLTSLTFRPICRPGFSFRAALARTSMHISLRCLHIRAADWLFRNMWSVLSPFLDLGSLDDIAVTIPDEEPRLSTGLAMRSILPGLGPLARSSILSKGGELSVCDASGRMRRVIVTVTLHERWIDFDEFWAALAQHSGGLDAMQSVCLTQSAWFAMVAAFVAHPLHHPDIEMRIVLGSAYSADRNSLEFDLTRIPSWRCSGLRRVVFEVFTEPNIKLHVALGMLHKIDRAQETEVCVADSAFRVQWVRLLNTELKKHDGWVLCPHCSASVLGTSA